MTNPRDHEPTLAEAVSQLTDDETRLIFKKLDQLDKEAADDESNISCFVDAIYYEVKRQHPDYTSLLD